MATTTHLVNITRKPVRIGNTILPGVGPAAPAATAVDLEALGGFGRQNLMNLISSGSVVAAADPTNVKLTYIAPSYDKNSLRGRARIGAVTLPPLTEVTVNLSTMTNFQRRDLIQLLASGSVLAGTSAGSANVALYNLSSKKIRYGTQAVNPVRITGGYAAKDVITLTNLLAAATGFKLTYTGAAETAAFVAGTNLTATAIQTALRTATGDAGLTVTGTTDTGPFTVTFSTGVVDAGLAVTHGSKVNILTLTGFSGTDTFKLTYNGVEGATVFTRGTNATAAALQTALRTATTDAGLVVTGTTDAGPYTVIFSPGFAAASDVTVTSGVGVTGATTSADVTGSVASTGAAPAAFAVTDVTALTPAQRLDLQWLLAAGEIVPLA